MRTLLVSLAAVLCLCLVNSAQAERRMFIIANDGDGYGVDRCLASGAKCGAAAANAYCKIARIRRSRVLPQGRPRRHHRRHPDRRLRRLPGTTTATSSPSSARAKPSSAIGDADSANRAVRSARRHSNRISGAQPGASRPCRRRRAPAGTHPPPRAISHRTRRSRRCPDCRRIASGRSTRAPLTPSTFQRELTPPIDDSPTMSSGLSTCREARSARHARADREMRHRATFLCRCRF